MKNVNEQLKLACLNLVSSGGWGTAAHFYGPFLTAYYPGNSLTMYFQIIFRSFWALSSLYRTDNLNPRGQQLRESEEDLGFLCGKVLNVGESL